MVTGVALCRFCRVTYIYLHGRLMDIQRYVYSMSRAPASLSKANYVADTPAFRETVAWSYAVTYATTLRLVGTDGERKGSKPVPCASRSSGSCAAACAAHSVCFVAGDQTVYRLGYATTPRAGFVLIRLYLDSNWGGSRCPSGRL